MWRGGIARGGRGSFFNISYFVSLEHVTFFGPVGAVNHRCNTLFCFFLLLLSFCFLNPDILPDFLWLTLMSVGHVCCCLSRFLTSSSPFFARFSLYDEKAGALFFLVDFLACFWSTILPPVRSSLRCLASTPTKTLTHAFWELVKKSWGAGAGGGEGGRRARPAQAVQPTQGTGGRG